MKPSHVDPFEVLRQSANRTRRIETLERELDRCREMRAMDACWLVRNTDLTRTNISAVLGISRVTLDKYLADAGMTDEYLAQVRNVQRERGVVLFSPDVSEYLPAAG
jgi:hypothetical protein